MPLKMKDDYLVRTLEELRDKFDAYRILEYYLDGRLVKWLKQRDYIREAEQILEIDKEDREVLKKICKILDVKSAPDKSYSLRDIQKKQEKVEMIKAINENDEIIKEIDYIAFNQEELNLMIQKKIAKVYLYHGEYEIDYTVCNITFVGIGTVNILLRGDGDGDFDSRKVIFNNITIQSEREMPVVVSMSSETVLGKNIVTDVEWAVFLKKQQVRMEELLQYHGVNFKEYIEKHNWIKIPHKNKLIEITSVYKVNKNTKREELLSDYDDIDLLEYNKDYVVYVIDGELMKEGYGNEGLVIKCVRLKDNKMTGLYTMGTEINRMSVNIRFSGDKFFIKFYDLENNGNGDSGTFMGKLEGNELKRISKEWIFAFHGLYNYIIYIDSYRGNRYLYAFNTNTMQIEEIEVQKPVYQFRIHKGYLYYLTKSEYDYYLYRIEVAQGWENKEKVCNFSRCSSVSTTKSNIEVKEFNITDEKIICKVKGKEYSSIDIISFNWDYSEMKHIYYFELKHGYETLLEVDNDTIALFKFKSEGLGYRKFTELIRMEYDGKAITEHDTSGSNLTPARELWYKISKRDCSITYSEAEREYYLKDNLDKQPDYFGIDMQSY